MKAKLKPIPSDARGTTAAREFEGDKFPSGWHYHPEIELTCVLESIGRRWIGDHVADFEPGDLVLLGRNLPHYWANDPCLTDDRKARCIVVQFREESFGAAFWELPEIAPIRALLDRAARGLAFSGRIRDETIQRMTQMCQATDLPRMTLLLDTLGHLAEAEPTVLSSPDFTAVADGPCVDRVERIYDYISSHHAGNFSYEELAESLGMSVSGLSHYFRRTVGDTLRNFIAEVRIGQACRRLLLTRHSVSQIAMDCGFCSLSAFNARFKSLRGMSPREFRKLRSLS